MSTIAPTRNPSTAGARWLFAEQEYLRRVRRHGKTEKWARANFQQMVARLRQGDDSDLAARHQELVALQQSGQDHRTEIRLVELERSRRKTWRKEQERAAARKRRKAKRANRARAEEDKRQAAERRSLAYQAQISQAANTHLLNLVGGDRFTEILTSEAARLAPGHFRKGTDVGALVRELERQASEALEARTIPKEVSDAP